MVERPTVNRMVVGSSPATGAKKHLTNTFQRGNIFIMKDYKPHITMLKVELKNEDENVLTIDMSDDFVKWFKLEHNLKRWAPKQFKQWLLMVLQTDKKS